MLDSMQSKKSEIVYTEGTFKSVRLINGYTSEIAPKKELIFSISHRFGDINSGIHNFYGLDQSTIRFGFEYGLFRNLDIGIGRSNYEDIYDGSIKVKLARQSSGEKNFPFTITLLEGISVNTLEWTVDEVDYPLTGRLNYIHELFISRKFNVVQINTGEQKSKGGAV